MPLCEPCVRSEAARNTSGNSDDRPSPVTNKPAPAAHGDGSVAASTTPTAARAAPARRVRSSPIRSVTRSPTIRPTSIPAGRRDVARARRARSTGRSGRRAAARTSRSAAARSSAIAIPTRNSRTMTRRAGGGVGGDRRASRTPARRRRSGSRNRDATTVSTASSDPGDEELHAQRDPDRRGAAGQEAAGHRAGRPHRVEAGDDRALDPALQLDRLAVHRHVGQAVEGAEHEQRREHQDGGRGQAEDRQPSAIAADVAIVTVRLPQRSTSQPLHELDGEPAEAHPDQRQPERGIGDAELALQLGQPGRPRRERRAVGEEHGADGERGDAAGRPGRRGGGMPRVGSHGRCDDLPQPPLHEVPPGDAGRRRSWASTSTS